MKGIESIHSERSLVSRRTPPQHIDVGIMSKEDKKIGWM
jgi:hypothetical protein